MSQWIVPHGLPPEVLAATLSQNLQSADSELVNRLDALCARYQVTSEHFDRQAQGCTPAQALRLQTLGLQQAKDTNGAPLPIGSAQAALDLSDTDAHEVVWAAQACSVLISAHGTTLVTLPNLDLTDGAFDALCKVTGDPEFASHYGITLEPVSCGLWRVRGQFAPGAWLPTPEGAQSEDASHVWPTDSQWLSWRQAVNEVQMGWHALPLQQEREERGLPAINTLWLYGGATGWTPEPQTDVIWKDAAQDAMRANQWGEWIQAWRDLIEEWWAAVNTAGVTPPTLVLTSDTRIVRLEPRTGSAGFLSRLGARLRRQPQTLNWRNWWNQ